MIIYLHGPDSYRSTQKLTEIKEKFIREVDQSKLNLTILDGTTVSVDDLNTAVSAAPFLARKRMVVVKNLITGVKKKELHEAVVELIKTRGLSTSADVIVVFWEDAEVGATNPLAKALKKEKLAQEFASLSGLELERWISAHAKEGGTAIEPAACRTLAAAVGSDLWRMDSELTKLAAYANGQPITAAMVSEQVRSTFDDSIFNLIDAIGTKQREKALLLLSQHIHNGEHELGILAMLEKHYRNLLVITDLQKKKAVTKDEIAKELSIHPFVAQKALAQVRSYTPHQLHRIYDALVTADFDIKRGVSGELLLDILIAKL